jgi:hypothetical protein
MYLRKFGYILLPPTLHRRHTSICPVLPTSFDIPLHSASTQDFSVLADCQSSLTFGLYYHSVLNLICATKFSNLQPVNSVQGHDTPWYRPRKKSRVFLTP